MTLGNWTDESIALLKQMHRTGYSSWDIRARLSADFNIGLTRNAVIGKISRLRVAGDMPASPKERTRAFNPIEPKTIRAPMLKPIRPPNQRTDTPRAQATQGNRIKIRAPKLVDGVLTVATQPYKAKSIPINPVSRPVPINRVKGCRFIVDAASEAQLYCDAPQTKIYRRASSVASDSSYCDMHHAFCHTGANIAGDEAGAE